MQKRHLACVFYKDGCKIKGNEKAWEGFIKQQLNWALEMKQVVDELV